MFSRFPKEAVEPPPTRTSAGLAPAAQSRRTPAPPPPRGPPLLLLPQRSPGSPRGRKQRKAPPADGSLPASQPSRAGPEADPPVTALSRAPGLARTAMVTPPSLPALTGPLLAPFPDKIRAAAPSRPAGPTFLGMAQPPLRSQQRRRKPARVSITQGRSPPALPATAASSAHRGCREGAGSIHCLGRGGRGLELRWRAAVSAQLRRAGSCFKA